MSTQTNTYEFSLDTLNEYNSVKNEIDRIKQAHWTVTLDENGLYIKVKYTEDL